MGEPYVGKGLMTEAVGAGRSRLPSIRWASTASTRPFFPPTWPRRRVLEKNGFREEGFAENYLQIDGNWRDHVLFGLTRERYGLSRGKPAH